MSETALLPWTPTDPMLIAPTAQPSEIVQRAVQLTERDQKAIVQAFQTGSYEMAATFIWSKAIAALKSSSRCLVWSSSGRCSAGRTSTSRPTR